MTARKQVITSLVIVALLCGAVLTAYLAPTDLARALSAIQFTGAAITVAWVAYQFLLKDKEIAGARAQAEEKKKADHLQSIFKKFDLAKEALQDLTQGIAEARGGMGDELLRDYKSRFASGDRNAFVPLLTAGSGAVLRKIVLAQPKNDKLLRRLGTFKQTTMTACDLSSDSAEVPDVLALNGLGRVYLAVCAALAPNDQAAQTFIDALKKIEGVSDHRAA